MNILKYTLDISKKENYGLFNVLLLFTVLLSFTLRLKDHIAHIFSFYFQLQKIFKTEPGYTGIQITNIR